MYLATASLHLRRVDDTSQRMEKKQREKRAVIDILNGNIHALAAMYQLVFEMVRVEA